ncbi:50S ribosomal protein L13 [Patescibacteria group bacterium]|nr:50S ribosomal protein L13 [Patescibacteria group bacterium]MBU1755139.1 50S ribosomal protein L13 [Patescibacteria group bacterium]
MTTIAQRVSKQRTARDLETQVYTVDAAGRTLGRVASEAASILLGKKSTSYVQNAVIPTEVTIINAKKLFLPERRIDGKTYVRYTGYPGGLREASMAQIIEKKGISEVLYKAVDGMIPRNKLRKDRMKRLTITD